jgi:hypothetical protein
MSKQSDIRDFIFPSTPHIAFAHAGYLLHHGENRGRFGGAGLSGSLGANAALPDASPPPELWAASSTAKAAEILIAKFR